MAKLRMLPNTGPAKRPRKLLDTCALPLFLALVCWTMPAGRAHAQADSTYFQDRFGTGQKNLDLVLRGLDVEHASYTFKDPILVGKLFHFRVVEYRDGQLADVTDLIEGKPEYVRGLYTYTAERDSFLIHSFARSVGERELEVKLIFNENHSFEPRFAVPEAQEAIQKRYSLRSDYFDAKKDRGRPVPLGEFFPFLVYAPPFRMDDGWFGYICSNPEFKLIPPEAWGARSGLSHYVVIELRIEDAG